MAKIIAEPKFCRITEEPDLDFLRILDKHLSFKYEGAEFTPAFKFHNWDGREYLLSKKLTFLTGLLQRVKNFYYQHDKALTIEDYRPIIAPNEPIDLAPKLKELNITPYDYQLEAIDEAIANDRMIFKHATGSGKSITTALITAKFNKPTAIWVISKDLLYQFYELFTKLFDKPIGIIGDGNCQVEDISIVSVWSAGRALGLKKNEILTIDEVQDEHYNENDKDKVLNFIKRAKIHHFDENHIASSSTIRTIYKNINPEKIFGFSGTPVRDDGADLLIEGIFGSHIHEVKASDLIRRQILSKPYICFNYIKGNAHYTDNYNKVYSDNIVNSKYRNNLIVKETKQLLDKGYQVLILFKLIKHGKILKELFEENNIDAEFLTGNDNAQHRDDVKQKLLSHQSNCVIASMVYDIGVDIKTLTALVLAGAGKSSVKTLQRVGRIIRNGKEKPFAAVVEFLDDCKFLKKHSVIRKTIYETEPEFVIQWPENVKKKNAR